MSTNILRDVIFYIKDFLDGQITDPLSSTRPAQEKFIMTSYPQRPVRAPFITIKDINSFDSETLGLQSEAMRHYTDIEIRIWARNVQERDEMADSIYQLLKDNQIGTSGTSQAADLHDFKLLSMINIDDPNPPGIKSKILTLRFMFIAI